MEAIINPMWFYTIGLCDSLINMIIFILIGLTFLMFITCLKGEKISKTLGIIFITLLIINSIIPTSSTLTKMLIDSQITYNRVENSVNVVDKIYKNIIIKVDKGEIK